VAAPTSGRVRAGTDAIGGRASYRHGDGGDSGTTFDVAVAAVVAASLLVVMASMDGDADVRSFDALAELLVVVAGGVLALHRRGPMVVLAASTAALALYSLYFDPVGLERFIASAAT
jgi:hypothetical protein